MKQSAPAELLGDDNKVGTPGSHGKKNKTQSVKKKKKKKKKNKNQAMVWETKQTTRRNPERVAI